MSEAKILSRDEDTARGKAMLSRCGYARGGRMSEHKDGGGAADGEKQEVERQGKKVASKTPPTGKAGGKAVGDAPTERMDKRARGGRTKHAAPVNVNIISPAAAQGEKQHAAKVGMAVGMKLGAGAKGMAPPPDPTMAGGMPPGPPPAGAAVDEPPMKRGGRTAR